MKQYNFQSPEELINQAKLAACKPEYQGNLSLYIRSAIEDKLKTEAKELFVKS